MFWFLNWTTTIEEHREYIIYPISFISYQQMPISKKGKMCKLLKLRIHIQMPIIEERKML